MRSRPPAVVGCAAGRLALVVLALVAAGRPCTTIRGLIDTEEALERAGFTDIDVGFSSNEGFDQIEIAVRPPSVEQRRRPAPTEAARVVWTDVPPALRPAPGRAGRRPSTGTATTYTYSEMAEIFGPRDPDLDEKELGDDVVRAGLGIAIVLAVGGLLFLAAVVLAIVFGVRASRRRAVAHASALAPIA